MNTVVLGSVRGAPGVTTTALLVAGGMEGSVLVEADLAGGVVAIRYGLGREPGLTTLAAAGPAAADGWREHAQSAGGVAVLVGPDSADHAESLWRRAGPRLGVALEASGARLVADVGRLTESSPLLESASLLIVLVRPVAEHLVALSHRIGGLRRAVRSGVLAAVLVGDGPYGPSDVQALGINVLGVLPDDRRAADLLTEGGRASSGLSRSRLARAAAGITETVDRSLGWSNVAVGAGP